MLTIVLAKVGLVLTFKYTVCLTVCVIVGEAFVVILVEEHPDLAVLLVAAPSTVGLFPFIVHLYGMSVLSVLIVKLFYWCDFRFEVCLYIFYALFLLLILGS